MWQIVNIMENSNLRKPEEYKLTEVISIVSHQLKSPISVVKSCLEILSSGDLGEINEKQKEYLSDAMENTKRMIELVQNFLDVSRIEEGRLDFKLELSSIEDIIRKMINEIDSLASAKNCSINFQVKSEIPKLKIDPMKIGQVVSNIISNAIEYSSSRGNIKINLKKRGSDVVFCCTDTGIGILDKDKNKIFSKFYRSEKAVAMNANGSGLGLFISKAIIEKSGGKIWFNSKEGEGSTFCFSLSVE